MISLPADGSQFFVCPRCGSVQGAVRAGAPHAQMFRGGADPESTLPAPAYDYAIGNLNDTEEEAPLMGKWNSNVFVAVRTCVYYI